MKQNQWKRTGTLLLALVLAVSLALPAAAGESTAETHRSAPLSGGAVVAAGAAAGGTGSNSAYNTGNDTTITGVSLSRSVYTFNNKTPYKLTATVTPSRTADQSVTWKSSNEAVATVDEEGNVTPVSPGKATITATSVANTEKSASCDVTVSGVVLNGDELNTSGDKNTLTLMEGKSTSLGVTVFGGASGTRTWESSDNLVASVSSGRVTARSVGTATITVTVNGYPATCEVTVIENTSGLITTSIAQGATLSFSTALRSKLNSISQEETGRALSYVLGLAVPTTQGILYYNYVSADDTGAGVGSTEQYYYTAKTATQRTLENITFVPRADFSGTANITYTGVSEGGDYFTGTIRVTVGSTDAAGGSAGNVRYAAGQGAATTFRAADFNAACVTAIDETLDYVRFTLPAESDGTLYYNYTSSGDYDGKVSANTRYYRSGSSSNPYLSRVTFVPADGAPTQVTINFTAYGTSGGRFEGTVVITYPGHDGEGSINYSIRSGQTAQFDTADFNELCTNVTGKSLDYVQFDSLPASSRGTLYYGYSSATRPGSEVRTSTRLYRSGSNTNSLSRVAFVSKSGYSGPVSIGFTGYATDGTSFSGSVLITVDESGLVLRYSVRSGGTLTFTASDFNDLCRSATGSSLNYVQFELPAASQGTLYYKYSGSNSAKVSDSYSYYRSSGSRLLEDVTFAASSGYTGTVSIGFTGSDVAGEQFGGKIEISIYAPTAEAIRYTGTGSLPVNFVAADFRRACNVVLEQGLSYVQFTSLPGALEGRLYSGYTGYNTGSPVSTSTHYYLSGTPSLEQIAFVPKAGFQGTVSIPYTGMDANGGQVTGTVSIVIPGASTTASSFLDMGNYGWAIPSVEYLYSNNIVTGVSSTQFSPGQSIQRCDFALMLCRAFGFNTGSTSSFPDVSAGSYYAQAVATARDLGIVTGSNGLFMPTAPLTRQDAMLMLQRAMNAAGKSTSGGGYVNLAAYSDNGQISDYARSAVETMVSLGIVTGNDAGQLMPRSAITRAEMAVILHRVLTL